MKIAVLNGSVSRKNGGLFEVSSRLARELSTAHSVSMEVLGIEDEFTDLDAPNWSPLTPLAFKPAGFRPYGYSPAFLHALETFRPDLCHVHGLWMYPTLAARRWSRRTGGPYMVSVHGMLDPWARSHARWKKTIIETLCERRNLHRSACLHAVSSAEMQSLRDYGLKNPVCVIPNGVDLPDPQHVAPAEAPWAAEIPRGVNILLYLGRLHQKKGLMNLIDAWRASEASAAGWHLVIVGWDQGGHEKELRRRAAERGVGDSVHFIGPRFGPEKAACYAQATAFILPSFSEGLPVVILEAWSHGLPVLMTPACNLPEGFCAEAALRIEANAASIAGGIATLSAMSPADRFSMGARGRGLVGERFTWRRIGEQMHGVYKWLLGAAPPPPIVFNHK